MSLHDTLSAYFSNNSVWAERLMRGGSSTPITDFMESINAVYNEVDSYGGEDQGSTYYRVYKFSTYNGSRCPGETVFIKFNGWYASHYGSEYRDFDIVTPQQRTITVYE